MQLTGLFPPPDPITVSGATGSGTVTKRGLFLPEHTHYQKVFCFRL